MRMESGHYWRVRSAAGTGNSRNVLPAVSTVVACKFNDSNGNGVRDSGELMISGWSITASVPAASYVTLRSDNQAGTSVTANTDSTGCVSRASRHVERHSERNPLLRPARPDGRKQRPRTGATTRRATPSRQLLFR